MDNVTHSLAGLVLAEAAVRIRARGDGAEPSPRFRAVAALASMVAANLPDADLFYTGVGGDRLTYLLHHRGHTHTVVVALLGALLLWGAATLALRRRAPAVPDVGDRRTLLALLLASTLSHLVLDWTNSYGVHPFWPLDDAWRYGDAVFIVEPWFWVVSVPALVLATTRRAARTLLALVLVVGLGLAWRVDLVSRGAAIALTAGAALSVALAATLRPGARIAAAVAGWVAVTLTMAAGAARARDAVAQSVRASDPRVALLDVVVTPLPASAVCMNVITVEREGATYRVATARASALPSRADAGACGTRAGAGPTFAAAPRRSSPAVRWDAEWTAPVAELATLARESCPALAALRFMRVPVWRPLADGTVLLGDARYGGASGDGFSDVVVPRRSAACPDAVPSWVPPRAELLGLGGD